MNPSDDVLIYEYLSDGTKFSRTDQNGSGLMYVGSLVYTLSSGSAPRLESTGFGCGRILATNSGSGVTYTPQYHVTDHLGSTRVVTDGTAANTVTYNYYPFGSEWTSADTRISDNRYVFNGKEKQVMGGMNYLDYGARFYDPNIGRWTTQDPLAEKYYSTSPYAYVGNNPIRRIDPDGKKWVNASGYLKYDDGGWTRYANRQDKLLAYEMQNTPTGNRAFEQLVNGPTPTEIIFGKLDNGAYGSIKNKLPSTGLISSKITLDLENMKGKAKDNGVTVMQATASTTAHEIRHTEDVNIQMQLQSEKMSSKPKYQDLPEEIDARAVGDRVLYEYKNNIKPKYNEKSNNRSLWDAFLDLF